MWSLLSVVLLARFTYPAEETKCQFILQRHSYALMGNDGKLIKDLVEADIKICFIPLHIMPLSSRFLCYLSMLYLAFGGLQELEGSLFQRTGILLWPQFFLITDDAI